MLHSLIDGLHRDELNIGCYAGQVAKIHANVPNQDLVRAVPARQFANRNFTLSDSRLLDKLLY